MINCRYKQQAGTPKVGSCCRSGVWREETRCTDNDDAWSLVGLFAVAELCHDLAEFDWTCMPNASHSRVAAPILVSSLSFKTLGAIHVAYSPLTSTSSTSHTIAVPSAQHAAHQQPAAFFHEE
jgi:hypothetical protein